MPTPPPRLFVVTARDPGYSDEQIAKLARTSFEEVFLVEAGHP